MTDMPVFRAAVQTAAQAAWEGDGQSIFDSCGQVLANMLPSVFQQVCDELEAAGYKADIPALLPVLSLTEPVTLPELRRKLVNAFVRNAMEVEGLKYFALSEGPGGKLVMGADAGK